jgi:DNA-binding NtrC family response regulator
MRDFKFSAEKNRSILVVDDDPEYRRYMDIALRSAGYKPFMAASPEAALRVIEEERYALIITDLVMPGMTGFELLATVRTMDPFTVGVITTAYGSVETAVDAVRRGAYDFLVKPSPTDVIEIAARRALEYYSLRQAAVEQVSELDALRQNCRDAATRFQKIAHRLRNPLSVVFSRAESLEETVDVGSLEPGDLRRGLGAIKENAALITSIVNELDSDELDVIVRDR